MALSGRRLPCQRLPLARATLHSAKFKPGGLRGGGMRITNVPIVAQPPRPEAAEAATCRSCRCFLLVIGDTSSYSGTVSGTGSAFQQAGPAGVAAGNGGFGKRLLCGNTGPNTCATCLCAGTRHECENCGRRDRSHDPAALSGALTTVLNAP